MKITGAVLAGALLLAAPAAQGQTGDRDGFKGQGAALCIAAGERLAAQPGADAGIAGHVLAWRQVLHVMEGTDDQRRAAVEGARASFGTPGDTGAGRTAMIAAEAAWSAGCATRDMQVRYIAVHASEERTLTNLADEPGSALGAEAAQRLNVSASCLVAAELFLQPRPSRALRAALRDADPQAPGRDGLQAILERSRREVDETPGSAVGKELLVDYLRYLYEGAAGGREPQPFVNRTSQVLQNRCAAGQ